MRKSPMEVKEINNLSTQHTIRDIAQRTAEDQAVAHRFETWPLLAQHAPQPSRNSQTQRDEKVTLPATSVRQKAECRTRIQDMNEVEKRGDFDLLTVGKRADDGELRELIGGVSGNPRKFRHSALWNFLGGWSAA